MQRCRGSSPHAHCDSQLGHAISCTSSVCKLLPHPLSLGIKEDRRKPTRLELREQRSTVIRLLRVGNSVKPRAPDEALDLGGSVLAAELEQTVLEAHLSDQQHQPPRHHPRQPLHLPPPHHAVFESQSKSGRCVTQLECQLMPVSGERHWQVMMVMMR
eukprot:702425-Rhodomonas_salina.1